MQQLALTLATNLIRWFMQIWAKESIKWKSIEINPLFCNYLNVIRCTRECRAMAIKLESCTLYLPFSILLLKSSSLKLFNELNFI